MFRERPRRKLPPSWSSSARPCTCISVPSSPALIPGKTWISATPAELGSPSSGLTSGISAFEQLLGNPVALVQQLNAGSTTSPRSAYRRWTALGSRATWSSSPPAGRAAAGASSLGTVTAGAHAGENLYVASNGQVKAIVIPVEVSSNGETFHESIHIVFSHYGHPVTVTPPPPSEVATLAQYQAALDGDQPGPRIRCRDEPECLTRRRRRLGQPRRLTQWRLTRSRL